MRSDINRSFESDILQFPVVPANHREPSAFRPSDSGHGRVHITRHQHCNFSDVLISNILRRNIAGAEVGNDEGMGVFEFGELARFCRRKSVLIAELCEPCHQTGSCVVEVEWETVTAPDTYSYVVSTGYFYARMTCMRLTSSSQRDEARRIRISDTFSHVRKSFRRHSGREEFPGSRRRIVVR